MTMTILEAMTLVQREVEVVCAPARGYVVQMKQIGTGEGAGIVLARRDESYHPYIVWRWATELDDGSRPATATGAMLWSGNYCGTYEEALKIFDSLKPR